MREPGRTRLTWVLGFLCITLLVVYAAFIFLYRSYRDRLEDELGQRLIAVASGAAATVGGDPWFRMTSGVPRGEPGSWQELRLGGVWRRGGASHTLVVRTF